MINPRKSLKSIAYWTLPPGIQDSLRKINKYLIQRKSLDSCVYEVDLLAQANFVFKNKHQGKSCFILATGPSIKEQNLRLLKGEICIAVSQFFLHEDIQIIKPQYHIIAPSHPPFKFDDIQKIFEGFKTYSHNVTYFLGHRPYEYSVFNFLKQNPHEKRENVYFINFSRSQELDETNYTNPRIWDICKSPFAIRTVIYIAIQIALYMGCNKIYLVGCDHDYLVDTTRVKNHHFYKEEDGISDVEHLSSFTTERWFEEYYFRWRQYRLMREYAKLNGCQIFNATKGGMLDVFPRVELQDVLQKQ
jgi:hypothetical protein